MEENCKKIRNLFYKKERAVKTVKDKNGQFKLFTDNNCKCKSKRPTHVDGMMAREIISAVELDETN